VKVDPAKSKELAIEETQTVDNIVVLSNLNAQSALELIGSTKPISGAVEKALESVAEKRKSLDSVAAEAGRVKSRLAAIDEEQGRIRANMGQLDRTSGLYSRYVKTLGEQEDEIQQLRKQLAGLQEKESAQREALEQFVQNLNIE